MNQHQNQNNFESPHILIVDDERSIRNIARRALEYAGFRVLTAANGQQAIDLFKKHATEIQVVILDWSMPDLNGGEVLREIRKIRNEVEVIFSSGSNSEEIIARLAGKTHVSFIQKPYPPDDLVEIIRGLLK